MKRLHDRIPTFARIALWQFAAFFLLLLLIWANEILNLSNLLYDTGNKRPDWFAASLLTAFVLLTAIICVGYSYVLQRRIISGMLVVCSRCNKVKLNKQNWERLDVYVHKRSKATLSHGLCPDCFEGELALLRGEGKPANETQGVLPYHDN